MREIQLTQDKIALVDDEDFEELNQYNWHANECGLIWYARRNLLKTDKQTGTIYMHEHIIGKATPGFVIDHGDSNGLNNQRYNLNYVTCRQNVHYKNISMTSIFPGVCWDKRNQKWEVRIKLNGKSKFLGRFDNEEDAARAYQVALIGLDSQETVYQVNTVSVDTIASVLLAIEEAKVRALGN